MAAAAAVAGRWRAWPAGRIFPAGLGYVTALQTTEIARREGISAGSGCRSAIVATAGRQALRDGCRAALRATYADQLQGVVYTIGVFAFAGPRGAAAFLRALAADPPGGPAGSGSSAGRFHASGAASVLAAEKAPRYGLRALAVPGTAAAWRTTRGQGVIVGVLDAGVDSRVPDLRGSVITGPDYTRGANPPGYRPPHWHGTFIASLIAGHGSGPGLASGVIGVAPAARILSVRVILDDDEPGFPIYNANANYEDAIASGIRYAVRRGAGVINMSLGSASAARQVRLAVGYAISHGVVVVASAGNDGTGPGRSQYSYPASFTGVISVGAVDAAHQRASFSDRNASVVICAPGVDVVGASAGGGYLAVNGTSPASAFVAGVAALIRRPARTAARRDAAVATGASGSRSRRQ